MPKTRSKVCRLCRVEKELNQFYRHRSYKDGHRSQCADCLREPSRIATNARYDSEKNREYALRRSYGLEISDYDALVDLQNGCCAICGREQGQLKQRLHVDHCHETGMIRGLLCGNCNVGLGMFRDNAEMLSAAMDYLGVGCNEDT